MINKQLHAGFKLQSIYLLLDNANNFLPCDELFRNLSTFNIEINNINNTKSKINDSIIAVIENLLSRGLPTISSVFVEEIITKTLNIAKKKSHKKTGNIFFQLEDNLLNKNKSLEELIYESLFVIDPRIKNTSEIEQNFNSWEKHSGSEFEEKFYTDSLPKYFDKSINQLVETQRSIKSILSDSASCKKMIKKTLGSQKDDFYNQRVDFSIQLPNGHGIVIEIDGSQHKVIAQQKLDEKRDQAIEKNNWQKTVRITTDEINSIPLQKVEQIKEFLDNPYYDQIKNNYVNPIWKYDNGLKGMQLVLSPFGIARIQKTIVYLISQGILDLKKKVWNFAFVERDVPCAELAIQDLQQLFENIFELEGKNRKLPKIKYKIFITEDFEKCKLNSKVKTDSYPNPKENYIFDFLFDVSLLQRAGLTKIDRSFTKKVNTKHIVTIRSSYSQKEPRLIKSAKPIRYIIEKAGQPKTLIYFLQNIFRKKEFREGQVNILRRSLRQKNVIALLPTGAGKSLTYQLSALLQPGIVIIVDPLKSLMRDQNDNLISNGIDSTVFINSSLKANERKVATENMINGLYQFVFISPERFQIVEFREYLEKMGENCFTYCVVDEAHCVSEWGHDFRTAYLRLGKNARKYCKSLTKNIPILGLTGTASFDVLADVQRELEIYNESAIVVPAKYERKELNFKIIPVNVDLSQSITELKQKKIKEMVANQKQNDLYKYLKEIPQEKWENGLKYKSIEDFLISNIDYKNSGLIFCPHVGWKFGIKSVRNKIVDEFPDLESITGIYAGSLDGDDLIDLGEVQNKFKKDEITLLVATKAFGMGIDKPNIRFTIHFNMPQSIESFYQEAGRAGRDREKAICYILYSPTTIDDKNDNLTTKISVDKSIVTSFHKAAFRGLEKEKHILWELLDEISYPDKRIIDDLNTTIEQGYGSDELSFLHDFEKPKLKIWFGDFPTRKRNGDVYKRIYLNDIYPKSVGHIDLVTEERVIQQEEEKRLFVRTKCRSILEDLYTWIKKNQPSNLSFIDWIILRSKTPNKKGFERTLDENESGSISINFKNKVFQEIEDKLVTNKSSSRNKLVWDESIIDKAYQFSSTPQEFIKSLEINYWKKTKSNLNLDSKILDFIQNNYIKIRNQQDTFKAIYRLFIIGVIDDYTVDYRTKTIEVEFSKKEDKHYIVKLTEYIGPYVTVEEEKNVPNEVKKSSGKTTIQKCCSRLINFVYDEIAKKRLQAIGTMEEAIEKGINDDKAFTEFINTYFDSKYTKDLRKIIKEINIDLIWKFLAKMKDDQDSYNHLNGACSRLLDDNPDNPMLLVLRAFARILLPNYIKSDCINDLQQGLKKMKELKKWSRKKYMHSLSEFYRLTYKSDNSVKDVLDDIIALEHLDWLKEFNKKILEGAL